MGLREDLTRIAAQDARYTIDAYIFVVEVFDFTTKRLKRKRARSRRETRGTTTPATSHVSGHELCLGARDLALRQYGALAWPLLQSWGIATTSDLGELVYLLIASGNLKKAPTDSRADFDDVFDLREALSTAPLKLP